MLTIHFQPALSMFCCTLDNRVCSQMTLRLSQLCVCVCRLRVSTQPILILSFGTLRVFEHGRGRSQRSRRLCGNLRRSTGQTRIVFQMRVRICFIKYVSLKLIKTNNTCFHSRPLPVCYCGDIVSEPIPIHNHLIVLQDPKEVKRCLRTTKILELSLPATHFHLYRGKRFGKNKFSELHELLSRPELETLLVWPSAGAESVHTLPTLSQAQPNGYNIILLDGTWPQARAIYNCNKFLQEMRCIKLDNTNRSKYVIRTQPTDDCLSTVEAAGLVLSHLEGMSTIMDHLTRPLTTICDHQLNMGAVEHQSKEHMITNGCYPKLVSQKVMKQLKAEEGKIRLNNLI